jgi:putative hydrolase of the HAD superfamily
MITPEWDRIDVVLLDMDGTLLDKHFDDHFWEEFVPERFAEVHDLPVTEAKDKLMGHYRTHEGTLNWTDLDFWSDQLGLDIPALKRQVDHLIAVHPYVLPFLDAIHREGKEVYLVTNAHGKTLDLKMEKTSLAGKFDRIFTSHELGAPKEEQPCWQALQDRTGFDPDRTLLAEDTIAVLESAARFGIRYLVHIAKSSTTRPALLSDRFYSINTFLEIMPEEV